MALLLSFVAASQGAAQPSPGPAPAAPAAPAPAQADRAEDSESLSELAQALRQGAETMSADQVAAIAVKTAPTVRSAQAANERARRAASEALVAVYPRLELEARYTRLSERDENFLDDLPDFGGLGSIDFETPLNQYLLQARLAFPVSDVLLQILPRYRAAQESAQAQALSAQAAADDVALQAREAFFNYARARAALFVANSGLAQSQAQRRDVVALVSAGTLARVEQMRADAQVATAEVALARAQGAVAVARTVLRSLLHRPGDQDIAIGEDFRPMPPLAESKDQLLARALQQRKELVALRTMTRAHEHRASAENSNKLPKLSVLGTFDYANPNPAIDPYEEEWKHSWAVMGSLTWSPSDFAAAGHRAGQAEADRAQTLADLQALEDALRREVASAYEDYLASRQAMESALTGILAAEESYRVRREQFRAGAAVATDVIDAESELRRARLELINAAIDVRIARARLDRAVGRGQG